MSTKKPEGQPGQQQVVGISDLVTAINQSHKNRQEALVGIRNICGSTIGLPPFANEPDITIHPYTASDPNSVAIISVSRWNQVKKSGLFGQGLLERFDEILDEATPRAPADKPEQCHPDHAKNRLPDPVAFIEGMDEGELRARLSAMTSENQLHHIIGTVDKKQREIENSYRAVGDANAQARGVRELPTRYRVADEIARQRLNDLSPSNIQRELPSPPLTPTSILR